MLWGGFLSAWHLDKWTHVWASFLIHTWRKIAIFQEFEKPSWDLRNTRKHTPGPLEAPDLRELRCQVTRRAVVSRAIRVQRRYAVWIWPMESITWGTFWMSFWIIYWAVQNLYLFFPHRIRLDDSFGQNIMFFHKIWAEYGAVKGFGSWAIFFDPDVVKNIDFS